MSPCFSFTFIEMLFEIDTISLAWQITTCPAITMHEIQAYYSAITMHEIQAYYSAITMHEIQAHYSAITMHKLQAWYSLISK